MGWANGVQHGRGMYEFVSGGGAVFHGQWSNGAYHGLGTLSRPGGIKEKVKYSMGQLESRETVDGSGEQEIQVRAAMHDSVKYPQLPKSAYKVSESTKQCF